MNAVPGIGTVRVGDRLPGREYRPDEVQLFLYNAALWNAHRIHFDHPYATGVEGHEGLVVPGPLLGDWLTQCVLEWLGERDQLVSFEYSNRRLAYAGEALRTSGSVMSIDPARQQAVIGLAVTNAAGEVVAPGTAVVRFDRD